MVWFSILVQFIKGNWKWVLLISLLLGTYGLAIHNNNNSWEAKLNKEKVAALELAAKQKEIFTKESQDLVSDLISYRLNHPAIKTKEVTVYVSETANSKCIINNGFVLMHNQSASGDPLDSRSSSNDAPSEFKLSDVAETVAENYRICNYEMKKLETLQKTVRAYQDIQK